jgi:hypothetical protein
MDGAKDDWVGDDTEVARSVGEPGYMAAACSRSKRLDEGDSGDELMRAAEAD